MKSSRRAQKRTATVVETPTLPETIVAPVDTFVRALVAWAAQHRDADLVALETVVRDGLRALAPQLVGGLITVTQRSLDPGMRRDRPRCPACGALGRLRGWRPRQMHTTCGPVRWERPWVQCPACRASWSPTDQTLGIDAQQRISASLQEWLVTLGTLVPFDTATEQLATLTGVGVSAETVRRTTETAGTILDAQLRDEAASVERAKAPAGPVDPAPDQLVAETDGVMVRYLDGWHEVKLGVVGGWDPDRPDEQRHLTAPSYVAARATGADWAARWGAEVARRGGLEEVAYTGTGVSPGIATLRRVLVLGDGARWIWTAAAEQFGERIEIVDWYHASEHVWAVARSVYGDGTAAATRWAEASLTVLYEVGGAALLERLRELTPETDAARATVATERGYFQTNRERMRYPEYRAAGYPIGSGAVESSAKHVIQHRLKRAGCRWSERGGQALIVLCAQHATRRARAA
jgi:hypothetical protein